MTDDGGGMRDLAAPYALGLLSPEEAREFEAFLETSPEAQREVREFREVAALVGEGNAQAVPSPELRDKVIARVTRNKKRVLVPSHGSRDDVQTHRPTRRGTSWMPLAVAASLIVTTAAGLVALRYRAQLDQRSVELDAALDRLAQREATLNRLLEPPVELYLLTSEGQRSPGMQVFWDRSTDLVVAHAYNLPPAPEGRTYQLWFIPADGSPPKSAAVFNSEPDGHALAQDIQVPPLERGGYGTVAVTLEPAGGSPQPTTQPVMAGRLGV